MKLGRIAAVRVREAALSRSLTELGYAAARPGQGHWRFGNCSLAWLAITTKGNCHHDGYLHG